MYIKHIFTVIILFVCRYSLSTQKDLKELYEHKRLHDVGKTLDAIIHNCIHCIVMFTCLSHLMNYTLIQYSFLQRTNGFVYENILAFYTAVIVVFIKNFNKIKFSLKKIL